jgi:RNA polymerase sigma-70 factor (ECF subfamily)
LVTEPDEQILIAAAQRDPRYFSELYEKHFDLVFAFIMARVRDRAAAEDLTSDVFHQALAKLDRYEWRGVPFKAWLLRIATNAIYDRWRAPVNHREITVESRAEVGVDDGTERRALIGQLLNRLPSDQRLVVTRRFIDGRGIAEIATELGRTEGAVKQLQFRALQTLRMHMRSHDE